MDTVAPECGRDLRLRRSKERTRNTEQPVFIENLVVLFPMDGR